MPGSDALHDVAVKVIGDALFAARAGGDLAGNGWAAAELRLRTGEELDAGVVVEA